MEDRRLWLIDAGYLFNAQKTVSPYYNFDYLKLKEKLKEFGEIWRTYYLNSTSSPPSDTQDSFHKWLKCGSPAGPGIITKLYQLKSSPIRDEYCRDCQKKVTLVCPTDRNHTLLRTQQKGVDAGLVTLALTNINNYDTLILSSGDGDLIDAVEYLTENGKRFELLVFKYGVSTDLQSRADKIHWINDFADEVKRCD
ncbi:MAG: NYN domain-containing protein [Desulfovibrionaceae bacterium]|nr:NYN domain-containing protein [Desulfovibrionaceae bacterium]MBF0512904.1 NYN domain-containing protein [Desulfovibrionaceae bacterium]